MAESFLAHGAEAMNGGDRNQVVVHVSAETLAEARLQLASPLPLREGSDAGDCCEFEHGPAIAAETARRLACDCSLVPLFLPEPHAPSPTPAAFEPLNIGRKTRTIPPSLRRALNARDRGCRFPGCCNKRFVDAHHIHHWANGGETKPSNLVSLCRFHHRAVHEGGVSIQVLDDRALRFIMPDGRSLESVVSGHSRPLDWTQLPATHAQEISSRTAVTKWAGESMDYGLAVQVLLGKERRGGTFQRERPTLTET